MSITPLQRGNYVASLSSAVSSGASGLQDIPELLRIVLEDDGWRDFVTLRGEHRTPSSFHEFVTLPPLRGLGADSVDQLRRLVGDDPELRDLIDRAVQRKQGQIHNNVKNLSQPEGNSIDAALRRLRKDAPELHAKVLAKELTPHAAMVQAGFRHKTITIPADDPERIAATLRRHLSDEARAELRALL